MDKLLVETKQLKPEYRKRERLWKLFYRRFCLGFSSVWKKHPIISFPLTIDIELGTMKYYYFKFGISAVINRIKNYNIVIANRLTGDDLDLDPKDFYLHTLLTDKQQVEDQLDKELLEYV